MKRLNPVGSLFGIGLTILLFVGLGVSLWNDRGLAFNPGKLTAKSNGLEIQGFSSHADFEKQCSYCHTPLTSTLAQKCLSCHGDVSQQRQSGLGVHSRITNLGQCAACHPEHKGRDYDPTLASLKLFDHSKTRFSLNWHQANYDTTPMQCSECHKNANFSIVENQSCLECHAGYEASIGQNHITDFGSNCLGCHDGADRMQDFDHKTSGFPLEGQHAQAKCTACHQSDDLQGTAQTCADCHSEPNMHKGLFQQGCETCHTPEAWTPAQLDGQPFDHIDNTGFSLALHQVDYAEQNLTCTTCHPQDMKVFSLQTCIDCHSQHDPVFMTDHQGQYGSECISCHDGVDRMHDFQHVNFFPLEGKHAVLQCADCHASQVYRGTPTTCSDCHKEPEIHSGVFGFQCADCHTANAWSPATLRQHAFPLNHGLKDQAGELQCDACHGSNYIEYTCTNCHDHQAEEITKSHLEEGIAAQDIPACAKCHPGGAVLEGEKKP